MHVKAAMRKLGGVIVGGIREGPCQIAINIDYTSHRFKGMPELIRANSCLFALAA